MLRKPVQENKVGDTIVQENNLFNLSYVCINEPIDIDKRVEEVCIKLGADHLVLLLFLQQELKHVEEVLTGGIG